MKDKLWELAKRWNNYCSGDVGKDLAKEECADELLAILDAEGDDGAVDRVEAHKSYDAIDRWLRNNMDDEEYAEYSAELDRVFSYQSAQPAPSAGVPDAKVVPYGSASGEKDYGYGYEKGEADGWNACRAAILAAPKGDGGAE